MVERGPRGEVGKEMPGRRFGERFETARVQVGWTRTSFADDERNFEILGGRVDKLKEKFEKTMRMKAASRLFSLGDVCEAPKFQPFDDEAWKRLEGKRGGGRGWKGRGQRIPSTRRLANDDDDGSWHD